MKTKIIAGSLVLACLATGCENPKQAIGSLAGAGLGGYAGSTIGSGRGRIVAAAIGAGLGAIAGGYVGQQLDQADKERAGRTCQEALESGRSGQTATWKNPDSGNSGTIIPQKAYQNAQGCYCREFQQTIVVGENLNKDMVQLAVNLMALGRLWGVRNNLPPWGSGGNVIPLLLRSTRTQSSWSPK